MAATTVSTEQCMTLEVSVADDIVRWSSLNPEGGVMKEPRATPWETASKGDKPLGAE